MTPRPTLNITSQLHEYVLAHSKKPDAVQRSLIEETARATGNAATMQVAPDQGAFLTLLARIMGARYAVEVGTFTGYSSLAIARGLADGGHMLCCDVSEEWTAIARRYWERAGLADRIRLVIGPAAESLRGFPATPPIDLAFIDADKAAYPVYYELIMERLAPGGVILVDNTLRDGTVADPTADDPDTRAMRAFNDKVMNDPRVTSLILPIADGLTMIRKN